jgi:hypothetical protein
MKRLQKIRVESEPRLIDSRSITFCANSLGGAPGRPSQPRLCAYPYCIGTLWGLLIRRTPTAAKTPAAKATSAAEETLL